MSDYASSRPVQVIVDQDEEQRVFYFPRYLLANKSILFRDYLRSTDSLKEVVFLSRASSDTFTHIVDWVFHQKPQKELIVSDLVPIYTLAGELGCQGLQNWVIDEMQSRFQREPPGLEVLRGLVREASTRSKIRHYLIRQLAFFVFCRYKKLSNSLQCQLLLNIDEEVRIRLPEEVTMFSLTAQPVNPAEYSGCYWHEHA